MEYGRAVIVDGLRSIELERSTSVIYDREIGPLEFVLDKAGIVTALEKVRTGTPSS